VIGALAAPGFDRLLAQLQPPKAPVPSDLTPEQARLRQLAPQMESFFYTELLKAMRASVPKNPYLDGGTAESVYTNLLDGVLAERAVGQGRGLGLAEMIIKKFDSHVRGMSRLKEAQRPAGEPEAAAPEEAPPQAGGPPPAAGGSRAGR
jgi:Rod binding domain-containing protein